MKFNSIWIIEAKVKERNCINKLYNRLAITILDEFKGEERVNGVFGVEEDFLWKVEENS